MTKDSYSFEKLPFSKLFKTYTKDFSKLQEFYPYNPFDENSIASKVTSITKTDAHNGYIKALDTYHSDLGISQVNQLQKLGKEDSLAIVTGQQLGIYGGPVFTIYKTITTILLAKQWEKKLGKPVVPVFWLADEDHDFDEVAWFGISANEDFKKIVYDEVSTGGLVSDYSISESIHPFKSEIKELFIDTDFSTDLWKLYDECFTVGDTFASAFAKMMDSMFGKHGLLIAGSNTREIKTIVAQTFSDSITKHHQIHEALDVQSKHLASEYHSQVVLGDTNLFYLDEKRRRVKIERSQNSWKAGDKEWNEEDLTAEISSVPEKFSPNVFLRPIIQDQLLPTLGYVAGPGETAYYGQMKALYSIFGLEMPVIFPRLSATLLESGIERIMEKLPFELNKYSERIEDLDSEYVTLSESHDIEALFNNWKQEIKAISDNPSEIIRDIDASLDGTVGKTISGFDTALDNLKGKVYRSVKQQEHTQLQRIRKIKAQLYPGGGLQERMVSFMYFMNKYGINVWDEVLELFEDESLDLSHHYIIKL